MTETQEEKEARFEEQCRFERECQHIADAAAFSINRRATEFRTSAMPYAAQAMLERVTEILTERI